MASGNYAARFKPVLDEIARRSSVAGDFIDKDLYQIYVATLWANLVMDPGDSGLSEGDLEPIHDFLNTEAVAPVLGSDHTITDCFRFVSSKVGEAALERCQVTRSHRDLLAYFCSMILDPEGHRKWADEQREDLDF